MKKKSNIKKYNLSFNRKFIDIIGRFERKDNPKFITNDFTQTFIVLHFGRTELFTGPYLHPKFAGIIRKLLVLESSNYGTDS